MTASAAARVSVIIPTYNRSALLMEAVESVLAQTHPIHEIVVVDDGSDASHRNALKELTRRSPLIRVYLLPHGERSRARNEGLARATGDFVLFLDDDDLLDVDMIASTVRRFAGSPVDVVVGRGQGFGDAIPLHAAPLNPFWTDSAAAPEGRASGWMGVSAATRRDLKRQPVRVLLRCPAPINAFLVRRDAIGTTHFPEDLNRGEDWIFWLDLAIKGCRFGVSPEGRAYVRRHAHNSWPVASTVVSYERVLEQIGPLGREEAFLGTALVARIGWLERRTDWWRPAVRQARHPDLLVKYGCQFLARRTFRLWLRASAGLRSTLSSIDPPAPRPSREPAPR